MHHCMELYIEHCVRTTRAIKLLAHLINIQGLNFIKQIKAVSDSAGKALTFKVQWIISYYKKFVCMASGDSCWKFDKQTYKQTNVQNGLKLNNYIQVNK